MEGDIDVEDATDGVEGTDDELVETDGVEDEVDAFGGFQWVQRPIPTKDVFEKRPDVGGDRCFAQIEHGDQVNDTRRAQNVIDID